MVRVGRLSQEKILRTTLILKFVFEPRVLRLPPNQPQPLLNLYRRGSLIRNVYLEPRPILLFCCHHCAQAAVGYFVGIIEAREPERRLFGQISCVP